MTMGTELFTSLGPILGGLVGVAALIKVFIDKRHNNAQAAILSKQTEVSAEDVAVRADSEVLDAYARLLSEQREQFEDYREYTDKRIDQLASELKTLRENVAEKDDIIALLRIDRDTLIQHLLSGKGLPIPDLHTTT